MVEEPQGEQTLDLGTLKILLFHGDQTRLKEFMSVLRWCGLRDITLAERLSEAFKFIVSDRFDLIIVTHVGEARETTRLLEELKGLDATADLPVVAITSDSGVKNVLRILAKGVNEVMVTPLSRKTVEIVVQKLLREHFQENPIKDGLRLGKELLAEGRYDEARKTFRALLIQAPGSQDVYLGLFQASCGLKQRQEAESYIKTALEMAKSCGDKTEAHRQLSQVFFHYGNYYNERQQLEKAIKSYRTALSLNPFHTESVKALLVQLQKRDEVDEIINVIREVHGNFLPYSLALEEVAVCVESIAKTFMDLNMSFQAGKIYEQLLLLAHESVPVHLQVADFFLAQGLVSPVLKHMTKLTQRLKDADILFKTGSVLLEYEKRFLAGNPSGDKNGVDLSFFEGLDSDKVLAMAQKILQQGMLMEPDSARFRLKLGCCHLRRGEHETATEMLNKLRESYADDAEVQAQIIDGLLTERAFDQAQIWIKDAIPRFPKDLRFYQLYSRFYREQKRPYDAIGCLKQGLSIQSEHLEFVLALAELYQEIGQYSDAIVYYEKAIKLAPTDQNLQRGLKTALQMKFKKDRK